MAGFSSLPLVLGGNFISQWIKLKDLVRLDSAYCNHSTRLAFLSYSQSGTLHTEVIELRSLKNTQWFINRKLKFRKLSTSLLEWQEGIDILLSELLTNIGSHINEILIYAHGLLSSEQILCLHSIIGQKCMNIQKADITGPRTDIEIAPLLCGWKSIRELNFKYCKITSSIFFIMSSMCQNLKRLSLYYISDIYDTGLTALAGKCPQLEKLFILDCDLITAKGPVALIQTTPQFNELALSNSDLTDTDITTIAQLCPMLHAVDLRNTRLITDVAVHALVSHCPELKAVNLMKCTAITAGYSLFRNLNQLAVYTSPTLTDIMVVVIVQNNPFLENVVLLNCPQLTSAAVLCILHGCPQLCTLHVSNIPVGASTPTGSSDVCTLVRAVIKEHYPQITMLYLRLK